MGEWLSLMEYATRNSVSLSTLRRQIKSGKLEHRTEGGRYLLWQALGAGAVAAPHLTESDETAQLRIQLKKAREEIAELKTLLAFYEEQSPEIGFTL